MDACCGNAYRVRYVAMVDFLSPVAWYRGNCSVVGRRHDDRKKPQLDAANPACVVVVGIYSASTRNLMERNCRCSNLLGAFT